MKLLTKLAFMLFATAVVAQQAKITGKVVDNTGEPLPGVNVIITNSTKGTQTDIDGNFSITTTEGNYSLKLSFIGFKTKLIDAKAPSNLSNITLYEGNELLQEVKIVSRNNTFSRKKTAYVSKLALKDIENPQVYSTVTSEILTSQLVTDLDEAMTNATGIYKLWEATGRSPGNGTSFFSSRGFEVQPRLIDGVAGVTFSSLDPSYIERIEVVKGPAATLFGSTETSLGGLINVVTKKPYAGTGGSVSYTVGSFGTHRASVDYNTSLGNNDKAYLRVNGSYLTKDSFQDAGFKDTYYVAPSVTYRVNNNLNISAGVEFSKTKQTNPSMLFLRRGMPLVSNTIEEMGVDHTKSFTNDDIYLNNTTFNTRTIVDYKISDKWSSKTIFSSSYGETDGYYQYQFDGGSAGILQLNSITTELENAKNAGLITDAELAFINSQIDPYISAMTTEAQSMLMTDSFVRTYSKRDANLTRINLQQNFTGDFKIGDIRNRMVIGADYIRSYTKNNDKNGNVNLTQNSQFPQLIGTLNALGLSNISDVVISGFAAFPYFDAFLHGDGTIQDNSFAPNPRLQGPTKAQLDADFENIPAFNRETRQQTLAAYVSDVINVTPNFTVSLGARVDYFDQDGLLSSSEDNYTKTTFSPSAGLLYQPIKDKLSVFANYQTGFNNVDPVVNSDGTITTFKPQKAVQFEGGVKTNLFNSKLNLGASYYHITVDDTAGRDPNGILVSSVIDIAEVVSKGIELELNANPVSGLNIRASYAFNDMKYTDVTSEKAGREIIEFKDRRPESAGPESLYNFWADYKFQEGSFAENFGLGFGFNGASENLTVNNATTGTFTLPSYTIFNASAYYDVDKFRVGFKVNNLTDKVYYTGWTTINAQPTRAFLGTISYKF